MPRNRKIPRNTNHTFYELAKFQILFLRLQQQLDQCKSRNCSSEGCSSDEGLGHSGSDGESNRTGSPTLNGQKMENPENIGELDADGKRKEDLYKCRFCDRTFCYLCHLKVNSTKIG